MIITEEIKKALQDSLNERWKLQPVENKGVNKDNKTKKRKHRKKEKPSE